MPKKLKPNMIEEGHFFLSSVATWRTGTDLIALLAYMKREGYPFSVWWVPVPVDMEYSIKFYAPQIEGSIQMMIYDYEGEDK